MMKRSAGILLHVSSLPGHEWTGTLGKSCFDFIDWLHATNIKYWQVLSLGPTGYGDSPYSPVSVFAGNPYFIDLTVFFTIDELKALKLYSKSETTDYGKLYDHKMNALFTLFKRGYDKNKFTKFRKINAFWIEQYAQFVVIKKANCDKAWFNWDNENLKIFEHEDAKKLLAKMQEEVNFHIFVQMLFFEQWEQVRKYANERGIQIIGDVPIYPAMDSADVWAYNNQFEFQNGKPTHVAGVPPDYFNEDGQLWGNPIYNFKQMARDKYKWWTARITHQTKIFDVLRIDHFRAFDTYYKIPYSKLSAKTGEWCKGPGLKFFDTIKNAVPSAKIILEDLGELTKSVIKLREQTGYPGMKVMQFGFSGELENEHLPINYQNNCVAYLGTHDNDTFVGHVKNASAQEKKHIDEYLKSYDLNEKDTTRLALENILLSKANVVILTMQDLLFQDSSCRMNTPGTQGGNWTYRIKATDLTNNLSEYVKMLIERSNRT